MKHRQPVLLAPIDHLSFSGQTVFVNNHDFDIYTALADTVSSSNYSINISRTRQIRFAPPPLTSPMVDCTASPFLGYSQAASRLASENVFTTRKSDSAVRGCLSSWVWKNVEIEHVRTCLRAPGPGAARAFTVALLLGLYRAKRNQMRDKQYLTWMNNNKQGVIGGCGGPNQCSGCGSSTQ